MNSTSPAKPSAAPRRPADHDGRIRARARARRERVITAFTDATGAGREVLSMPAPGGAVLVFDRDAATRGDRRLVGHLGSDEPEANARLLARLYAADASRRMVRCRALQDADMTWDQSVAPPAAASGARPPQRTPRVLVDRAGREHSLQPLPSDMSIPELRWLRRSPLGDARPVSVREVVAALESYQPVRELTESALLSGGGELSTATLKAELARVLESPIVLNRRLREEVLDAIARRGLTLSEIALRCGRSKRDRSGSQSGDTSWLARRLGLLPEGGQSIPTPWIHSEVLALIARSGLAVSPREVEAT